MEYVVFGFSASLLAIATVFTGIVLHHCPRPITVTFDPDGKTPFIIG